MLRKRGHTVREVPMRYQPRSLAARKKICFRDGLIAIWTLLRLRL